MKKEEKIKFKEFWKKFWFIIWEDDSFKGWIISIIFIFVVIKFIFFPLLNLTTGTSLPLAIVESCSMHHQGNLFSDYDSWWKRKENKYSQFQINEEQFENFNFKKGFSKGDIIFITKAKPEKLEIGDIIVFEASSKNPIIHRIIAINENSETKERTFSTIGDNNNGQLELEKNIEENHIIGKARVRIAPYIGWVKLIFYENSKPVGERGLCKER